MLRSLHADPGISTIPYLGGTAAVGAIVAVLVVFAPSGLGVREASMYGLLEVIVSSGAALGVTVLNRLAITIVEALLLGAGLLATRISRRKGSPVAADGEVHDGAEDGEDHRGDDPDDLLARGDAGVAEHAEDGGHREHERDDAHGGPDPVDHS
jgi:hypothetical protein